jgi:hypothetical protein
MDLPRSIPPVWDLCIYCGEPPPSGARLGDEHIIPAAFGGLWVLRGASCRDCERITSRFEKDAADSMVTPVREHLGLFGRASRKPRKFMAVNLTRNGRQERYMVKPEDHPGAMIGWAFNEPGLFTDQPLSEGITARVSITILVDNFEERVKRLPGEINLLMRPPCDPVGFARMLAKIAHAYAVAKLGPHGFRPLLTDLILGRDKMHLSHYVGTSPREDQPTGERHYVSLATNHVSGQSFLVAEIKLFGHTKKAPIHTVIVGEPLTTAAPHAPVGLPTWRSRYSGFLSTDGHLIQNTPADKAA